MTTNMAPAKRKSRRTWILPCEGTWLVLCTKDHAHLKMRPLYIKIMVYRPFSLAVGRLKEEEEEEREDGRFHGR